MKNVCPAKIILGIAG